MVLGKLKDGSSTRSKKILFGTDPLFLTISRKSKNTKPRKPTATMNADPTLQTFFHTCTFGDETRTITYRAASGTDLEDIRNFVDFWLSGKAKRLGIPGSGTDCFIPKGQQIDYLKYKTTYIATFEEKLIGWSVKSKNKILIHLLIVPEYRGKGIGGHLLHILDPEFIRSKSDQSTGDPRKFYEKHGYEVTETNLGKNKNIDLLIHPK